MSDKPEDADPLAREKRETYEYLSIGAWIAVAVLALNISYFVGEAVGGITYTSGGDIIDIFNGFMIGLLKASPTILIAVAMVDFAFFFHRCSEGAVFTKRNVSTLRSGADSLVWAAIMSAVVVPVVLGWTGDMETGNVMSFTDLALAVGLMGLALHGLATVFRDAVALKEDNDQIV